MQRVVLLWILSMLYVPLISTGQQVETAWRVTGNSSLTIYGSSNVNKFQCSSLSYKGDDVLLEVPDPAINKLVMSRRIVLKANSFDCRNSIMAKDLKKTIQAEKYPQIVVLFLPLQRTNTAGKLQKARGIVEICLAGVSRQYEVEAGFEETGRNRVRLKGSLKFSFTDFNMDPPTKMMGAIKVDDCLSVYFNLELQRLKAGSNIGVQTGRK